MPTSDEELAKRQREVEKLRQQVADAEADAVRNAAELANDVTATQLDREEKNLQARLADLKSRNTKTALKQGAAAVLDPEGTAAKQEKAKAAAGTEQLVDSSEVADDEQKGK